MKDIPKQPGQVPAAFKWPALVLAAFLVMAMFAWPLFFCLPIFLPAIVVLIIVLKNWKKTAPADILFRLGALAACNVVQCWLPVYYWTTYTSSGDERDGSLLFPAVFFCPISWLLALLIGPQALRAAKGLSPRQRLTFCVASLIFILAILSTAIPMIRTFVEMFQFMTSF